MIYRGGVGAISIFILSVSVALAAIITGDPVFLIALWALSIGALIACGQGLSAMVKVGRYSLVPAIFVLLLHLFSHDGPAIFRLWFLTATIEGARTGLFYGLKLVAFAFSGYLIFAAVDPFELVAPLERVARKAGPLGRPMASAALAFFLAMRFIPELVERGRLTSLALRSRGMDFRGGLRQKARFSLYLIAPLFAGAIKRAGLVALALDVKGYGTRYYRARSRPARLYPAGAGVVALAAGVLVAGILTA